MTFHLIVRHPFGHYERGERITDPDEVARLAEECGEHVIRVAIPEAEPGTGASRG